MDQWISQIKDSSNIKDIPTPTQDNTTTCESHAKNEEKLIQDFGSYTTLHGFHFILDSGSLWRRALWSCLIVFGFAFLIVQIWFSLHRLNSKEVVITKSVEVAKALPFPAVTICNQNMMKRSIIEGTIAQDYLDQMDKIKFVFAGQKYEDVPSFDIEKTLQKAGHQIQDMIQYCEFAGQSCLLKDFIPAMPSFMHGLCYTFTANSSAVKEVSSGKRHGLQIRLNAEPNEYYGPFSYDATGFKITVHEPGTYHDIENNGYDVSPGFYSSIRIKRKKIISKPPPYRSKCGSKKLHNFERYTRQSCFAECWSQITARECKCRFLGMCEKGINITRFCNNTEINQCFEKLKDLDYTTCGCPLQCEEIQYSVQISMAYYPSYHLLESLLPLVAKQTGLNASDPKLQDAARKQYAVVHIFYEDLMTDVTEEKELYGLSNFGTDVGGNMGLFLGCSLLTICEFIDLIVIVCLRRWRKKSAKLHGTVNDNSQNNFDMKPVEKSWR